MAGDVGYLTAFLAGILSFLSPCVLPLIPGYLSYVSGLSVGELEAGGAATVRRVLLHTILFVAGFSLVFTGLGAAATAAGGFMREHARLLNAIAGVLIIAFGLQLLGVGRFRFLMADRRYHGRVRGGVFGSLLLGMAFAFGWTPCVGPILFSILAFAGTQETVGRGVTLLASYSAGIGIPFILVGAATGAFLRALGRFTRYLRWVEVVGGALLVLMGVLVLTGSLERISGFLLRVLPAGG